MAEYYTLTDICKRLEITPNTFYKMIDDGRLLAYRKNRPKQNRPITKPSWYTNDELIRLSEIARCRKDREERLRKQGLRKKSKQSTANHRQTNHLNDQPKPDDISPQDVVVDDPEHEKG